MILEYTSKSDDRTWIMQWKQTNIELLKSFTILLTKSITDHSEHQLDHYVIFNNNNSSSSSNSNNNNNNNNNSFGIALLLVSRFSYKLISFCSKQRMIILDRDNNILDHFPLQVLWSCGRVEGSLSEGPAFDPHVWPNLFTISWMEVVVG